MCTVRGNIPIKKVFLENFLKTWHCPGVYSFFINERQNPQKLKIIEKC